MVLPHMPILVGKLSACSAIKKSTSEMVGISYLLGSVASTPATNRLAASPPRKYSTISTLIFYYFLLFTPFCSPYL
jgi:hypothetical protein